MSGRYRIAGCALLVAACGGRPEKVAPVPGGTPVTGDVNGDGYADVSDVVWLRNGLLAGGPGPACFAAADVLRDDQLTLADLPALASAVLSGQSDLMALPDGGCVANEGADLPQPERLGLEIVAEDRVGATWEATVQLRNPEIKVQAWSISIEAEGLTVTEVGVAGTAADPGAGQLQPMHDNFHTVSAGGGAVAGVVVDLAGEGSLPPHDAPWTVLTLRGTATPPASGCDTAFLRLRGGQQAAGGPPIRNVVTSHTWSYEVGGGERKIKVCAGE